MELSKIKKVSRNQKTYSPQNKVQTLRSIKEKKGYENEEIVVIGDGELDEGSNWESLLFCAHHKLNNIVIIIIPHTFKSSLFII